MAEEGDLEAGGVAARIFEPAGDVPPFVAKGGMAAVILRKLQRVPGRHFRIRLCCACCGGEKQQRAREEGTSLHCDFRGRRRWLTSRPSRPARRRRSSPCARSPRQ